MEIRLASLLFVSSSLLPECWVTGRCHHTGPFVSGYPSPSLLAEPPSVWPLMTLTCRGMGPLADKHAIYLVESSFYILLFLKRTQIQPRLRNISGWPSGSLSVG